MTKRVPRVLFLCVLVGGIALRLLLCALPTEKLLTPTLFDDTFIGLKMSRNMAQGEWITWDGETKTNAVTNPLYLVLMAPVYYVFQPRWDFSLHVILGISALVDGLTIWLIYSFVSYLAGRRAGLFASILWAFNPYVISFVLSGSEHSFESCAFIACIYYYIRVIKLGGPRTTGRYFLLGLLLGLTMMVRVSLLFLFIAILIDIVVAAWRSRREHGLRLSALVNPLVMAIAFALVLLPWFAYSFGEFGTIFPHNSGMISYFDHNYYLSSNPGILNWLQAHARFMLNAFNSWAEIFGLGFLTLSNPYPLNVIGALAFADLVMIFRVCLLFAGGTVLYFSVRRLASGDPRLSRLSTVGFALAVVFFLTLYYGGILWKLDKRYFIGAMLMFSVCVPVVTVLFIDAVWKGPRSKGRAVLVSIAFLALLNYAAIGLWVWKNGPDSAEDWSKGSIKMYQAMTWANENLPEESVVACFNPGIYGYYLRHKVVDICGITDKAAWEASKRGELLKFIWEKKADYILDHAADIDLFYPQYLTKGDRSFLNYIIEGPLLRGPIHLYIVKGPDGSWDGPSMEELKSLPGQIETP